MKSEEQKIENALRTILHSLNGMKKDDINLIIRRLEAVFDDEYIKNSGFYNEKDQTVVFENAFFIFLGRQFYEEED